MQDFEAYQEKAKFILEENKKKLRELDDNILIHLENKIKKYGNGAEFEIPSKWEKEAEFLGCKVIKTYYVKLSCGYEFATGIRVRS